MLRRDRIFLNQVKFFLITSPIDRIEVKTIMLFRGVKAYFRYRLA